MRVFLASTLVLALACSAFARIDYTVRVTEGKNELEFEMVIPSDGKPVEVQIPNWAPGSYRLVNNHQYIREVSAVRASRKVTVAKTDDNTWVVSGGMSGDVVLKYSRTTGPVTDRMHITGPAHYMYVKNRLKENCTIKYELPAKWRSTGGLDVEGGRFISPDYDTLADNPVTLGDFVSDYYEMYGVKHEIAYFGGDVTKVDREKVIDYCKKITVAQEDFWGGLPFKKYVWHFTVMNSQDGGWGLEHLSSTTIGLAAGVGQGTVSVMCHEYFHAWNVKRIRSEVLGPFNYLVLPKTGALWLLEGVTDYYADLLLYRYGIFDEDYFKRNIISNVQRTRANAQRFEVSPYDSSYRVGEAANGQGNSAGFGVNYYNTGWLVGLCLDMEIREQTGGKKSLDDLMHALWEQCKDGKQGFDEGDIRKHLVQIGGPALGTAYDNWVMKPGELPVEAQVQKIGYEFATNSEKVTDLGFTYSWSDDDRMTVTRPSRAVGMQRGDEIISVNGVDRGNDAASRKISREQWTKLFVAGTKAKLVIQRGDETVDMEVDVSERTVTDYRVNELPGVTSVMRNLRKGWSEGSKSAGL